MSAREIVAWEVCTKDGTRQRCGVRTPCGACLKLADARIAALAAAGFKVLAREPTRKMIADIEPHAPKIISRHDIKTPEGRTRLEIHVQFGDIWRVMFDAAPPATPTKE